MSDKPAAAEPPEPLSLRRWSQRKLDARRTPEAARIEADPATSSAASDAAADVRAAPPPPAVVPSPAVLPPIESLTIESDYAPFLQPHVDAATRRAALKQLFRDPRFNIMDGLDVYIDDYTKSDPIPPEMLKQLAHARHVFDPPRTMVNAEGHVVDVVETEPQPPIASAEATAAAAAPAASAAPASAPGQTADGAVGADSSS